ncbi:MAG: SpoIIE family protein phosphatase [Bacteroidia bacterium]
MALFTPRGSLLGEISFPAYVENEKKELNRAFQELPPDLQSQLFELPEGEIFPEPPYWQKIRLGSKPPLYIFLSAELYVETLKRNEDLEKEVDFLRNRLQQFVEKAPFPLVIVELPEGHVQFVSKFFLEACRLPLKYLYENHTLPEYVRDREVLREALDDLAREGTLHRTVTLHLIAGYERHWLLQGYTYTEESKKMALLGLIDITKEKEQELALEKAYEELNAQHEELTQSQHELLALNHQLSEAYIFINTQKKELEDSLHAAQQVQKALLQNDEVLRDVPIELHKLIQSHSQLSGDFLWMQRRGRYVYVAVGDATGHGASGAMLATLTYAFLSQALYEVEGPHEVHLLLSLVRSYTLRAFQIQEDQISTEGAEIVMVAFHAKAPLENPVYLTGAGGRYILSGEYHHTSRFGTGFYVPGMPAIEYELQTFHLQSGQWLWLLSDGILDQQNSNKQKLGRNRLLAWIRQAEAHPHPIQYLEEALHAWRGKAPLNDDITLLGMRF